ncbi:hypothetical protein J4734_23405 [Klebsiella pneumoniae]|uniref:Uncharacterized protein n=1 Tax=Klebsiella pneumoniae TaxID=573 RepID=A0A939NNG1_KLEPN|nr:hypothetical protein [Klebsiella pneumoniae]
MGLDKLIKSVKKVDDYHVQFELNEPNAFLPTGAWTSPLFCRQSMVRRC